MSAEVDLESLLFDVNLVGNINVYKVDTDVKLTVIGHNLTG